MSNGSYIKAGAEAALHDYYAETKTSNPYKPYQRGAHYWQRGYDEWSPPQEVEPSRIEQLEEFAQKRVNDLPEGDEQYAMQALLDLVIVLRQELGA